jgi:replicative DNA helicase
MEMTPEKALESANPMPAAPDVEKEAVGAIFANPSLINQAMSALKVENFFLQPVGEVYNVLTYLSQTGMELSPTFVIAELQKRGRLEACGGEDFVNKLAANGIAMDNINSHIKVLKEKFVNRQIILLSNKASIRAYKNDSSNEVIDELESKLFKLNGDTNKSFTHVSAVADNVIETADKLQNSDKKLSGLATGLVEFDNLTCGLQKGELIIVAARPGMGKAQPLDSKILTPYGWTTMGRLKIGDKVIGSSGYPCNVTGVFPQGRREVYEVEFSDHTKTRTCLEHLWYTEARSDRRKNKPGSVKTLREIKASLKVENGKRLNHSIPFVKPVKFAEQSLRLHPYLMGALLGDGGLNQSTVRFTNFDNEIVSLVSNLLPESDILKQEKTREGQFNITREVRKNHTTSDTRAILHSYGLGEIKTEDKFIPFEYMLGSVEQRLQLLAGLCDTDGYPVNGTTVELTTVSERLHRDIRDLVLSLGGKWNVNKGIGKYKDKLGKVIVCQPTFRMQFSFPNGINPFYCTRKRKLQNKPQRSYFERKFIKAIEYWGEAYTQCITVDSPDNLYVTDDYILTHNSAWGITVAHNAVVLDPEIVIGFFSLEMSNEALVQRMLSGVARVDSKKLRNGDLTVDEWKRLNHAFGQLQKPRIFFDDSPALTLMELRAKSMRLRSEQKRLDLIVVDYLQLMSGSSTRFESRFQEVSQISRGLKALAKELHVPLVALSQLSRAPENRADHRPQLSDLRETGQIEQDADVVCFLYREEEYNPTPDNKGIAEQIVAKQRMGDTDTIRLGFLSQYTKFQNLILA